MPLSKEFYLDEIRSKHPNSYNESLKDLPIKDLEDMLDFLDEALSKADGGSIGIEVLFGPKRGEYQTGGQAYDSRATAQDYANALKSVSAGTTYQQQADAERYARNKANEMLTEAFRSGNINQLANQFNFKTDPSLRFEKNRSGIYGLTQANRENVLKNMAQQMLSYPMGGSSAPMKKSPLQLKIEENQRIYDEYVKNNPPAIGIISGPTGQAPTAPPPPEYENQELLSKLTMLTPEEAFAGETFDTLSDLDQYNFAQAFTQFKPQLRDPNYVSPYGAPSGRDIFARRYGIKDGGRVGFRDGGNQDFPPFKGPKGKKRGFETVMDGPDAGAAARAYLAQQKQQKQLQPTKALASTPKPSLENINSIRESMTAYGFSEPEILKAIAQAGYAEGGRVGLFMGGPALEGQALSIYDSMKAYGFTDQEIADALSARGLYTPGESTQPEQVTGIIGAQINQDRDDGPKGDFGLFGDLLKDTEKTFTKNVYTQTGPVTFDFVPTEVKGYKNVKTGNYQTESGKNINHLGIEVPTIAGLLFDKNFGKGPQVGDIEGTFTKGIPAGMKNFFSNPFNVFKKQQATIGTQNAAAARAIREAEAKAEAERQAALANAVTYQYNNPSQKAVNDPSGGNRADAFTGGGANVAATNYTSTGKEGFGYGLKDGGLVTMFKRKR
jgi:hypothetical protein